jgi:PHD/YefM family antitoxin component YafN of YafNO toxin-antitoxin module
LLDGHKVASLEEEYMAHGTIPYIDPNVRHVGVSKLRELNASKLKELGKEGEPTLVIQDNDTPLAVLLSYDKFLMMQEKLTAVLNTIELLTDSAEKDALFASMDDVKHHRVRSLSEIEAEMKQGK